MRISRWVGGAVLIALGGSAGTWSADTARKTVPEFTGTFKSMRDGWKVTFTPAVGHHFNPKAPNRLTWAGEDGVFQAGEKPEISEREVVFPFKAPRAVKPYNLQVRAKLYICDDAKTFCMPQDLLFTIMPAENKMEKTAIGAAAATPPLNSPSAKPDEHGFYVNAPDAALREAKAKKRPLLIDFFGIWCPPCNELDALVFRSPEFQAKAKGYVKLKLDADQAVSWPLKERYRVGGYPTVVFATADGDEIGRIVGSRSRTVFVKKVEAAYLARKLPLSKLKSKSEGGDAEASLRLAQVQMDREEYTAAAASFARAHAHKSTVLTMQDRLSWTTAKIKSMPQETEASARAKALREAIQSHPHGVDTLDWGNSLSDLGAAQKDSAMEAEGLQVLFTAADFLLKQDEAYWAAGEIELTRADVLQIQASAYKQKGDKSAAKTAYAAAALEYEKKMAQHGLSADVERGFNLERAYCLAESGKRAEAEALYARLEQTYPDEFTFFYAHASLLRREKDFKAAEPLARKAHALSYGDNRLRATELLAKVLVETSKRDEAKAIVAKVLADTPLPGDPQIRTHRYVQNLKKLEL